MAKDLKSRIRDRGIKQRIVRVRQVIGPQGRTGRASVALSELFLYPLSDVCSVLGRSPRTIQRYISAGLLDAYKVDGQASSRLWFTQQSIERFRQQVLVPRVAKVLKPKRGKASHQAIPQMHSSPDLAA